MKRFPLLAALAAIDLGIAFATQTYVLAHVGVGATTDAFFAGQALPLFVLAVLQLPVQRATVSAYSDWRGKSYPALWLWIGVIGAVAAFGLLAALLSPLVISFLYSGLDPEVRALAVKVLQIQGITSAIASGNLVLLALNQLSGRFYYCESVLVAASMVSAVFVLLTVADQGMLAAVYGQLLRVSLIVPFYILPLRRHLNWGRPPVNQVLDILKPLISVGTLTKLAPVIDRSIASGASTGAMTVLAYTQWIYGSGVMVAERSLIAPKLVALKERQSVAKILRFAFLLALAGACSAVALFLGATLLGRSAGVAAQVGEGAVGLFAACALLLAGVPVGTLSVQWMAAVLTVFGNPGTAARIVGWGFLASISLKVLGFALGGIYGLAVGISVYYLLNAAAFVVAIKRSSSEGKA